MKTTFVTHLADIGWLVLSAVLCFPAASLAVEGSEFAAYQPDLLLLEPAPAKLPTSWEPLRYAVAVETRTTWLQDNADKRMMGKRAPTGVGLSLDYDAVAVSSKTWLALDLGWLATATSTTLEFSALTEKLNRNLLFQGVSPGRLTRLNCWAAARRSRGSKRPRVCV